MGNDTSSNVVYSVKAVDKYVEAIKKSLRILNNRISILEDENLILKEKLAKLEQTNFEKKSN